MMAVRMKDAQCEEELLEAFKFFDPRNTGKIPSEDLEFILTNVGEKLKPEEILEFLNEADPGNKGFIEYPEYVRLK